LTPETTPMYIGKYAVRTWTWFFKVTELDHLVGSVTNKPPSRVT